MERETMEEKFNPWTFEQFIKNKKRELEDFHVIIDQCADKISFIRDFFMFIHDAEPDIDEKTASGLSWMLNEIEADLRLCLEELSSRELSRRKSAAEKAEGAEEEQPTG